MLGVIGADPLRYDQFFTKDAIAAECVTLLDRELACNLTDFSSVVEPAFGGGAFVRALEAAHVRPPQLLYMDIDAAEPARRVDFLHADMPEQYSHAFPRSSGARPTCLTIGTPPFGKNASLAVAFFNRAAQFSDVIAFVVPRTFEKTAIHNRLHLAFFLATQHYIPDHSFTFRDGSYHVPCVFQIWVHASFISMARSPVNIGSGTRIITPRVYETSDFDFVRPEQGPDVAIRRVGVNAGRMFEDAAGTRAPQSHLFLRAIDRSRVRNVLAKLRTLDLEHTDVKFRTSGNPSISKSEICRLYTGSQ